MQGLGPFPPDDQRFPLGIAVSGGADSLCLAWLMRRWRRAVMAFIVDHGLREGSAAEAQATAQTLAGLDIPVKILTVEPLDRTRHVQEKARAARYKVLAEACRSRGILDLALGHHCRDQVETLILRQSHGSSPHGLASMALVRETPDLRFLRPLLEMAPRRLRVTLQAQGLQWVDDPSNCNPVFERVRVRQALCSATIEAGVKHAGVYGRQRNLGRDRFAENLVGLSVDALGFAVMKEIPDDIVLLGKLWQTISGALYAPAMGALQKLIAAPAPSTLSGAMLCRAGRLGSGWVLMREPGGISERCIADKGIVWDRRFHLCGTPPEQGATIAALGDASRRFRHHPLPARILAGLPALWQGPSLTAVPLLGEGKTPEWAALQFAFSPSLCLSDSSFWPEYRETAKT